MTQFPTALVLPSKHYVTMPTQAQLQADLVADAAVNVNRRYILPAGTFTVASVLTLTQGQTLLGQSRDSSGHGTVFSIGASGQIVVAQQSGLERMRIVHSASATLNAILATEVSGTQSAHQITLRDVDYTGGSMANGTFALHLKNPTEWHFERLKLSPSGNGILIECTNDYAFNPGDGYSYDVGVRLQTGGTVALRISGQQGVTSGGVYNIRYPNDQHWFGFYATAADIGAGWPTAGNIGIDIINCSKVFFYGVNLEELQTNFQVTGSIGSNINTYTVTGGTGYTVGDVLTFSNAHSGTQAQATVATLTGSAVATLTWTERGSLYQVGDVLTVTGGTGTGAGLTVSTVGGPGTAAVRFFGSWFGGAWTINAGVTDAHFDGKFDAEPTGANVANISINGVRTGLGSSVAQMTMPHIRGPLGGQLLPLETYVTNSSGADIANNRVCYWTAAGTIDLMTSAKVAGLFAGVSFGTVSNGTSGYIVSHGIAKVASKGTVAVGDYLVVDPSNPGFVISTGTTQSSSQPTVGMALSAGSNATITMRIGVLPPAPASSPAATLGGQNLATGFTYSSGLTWTTNTPSINALCAAPITVANSPTVTGIGIDVTALGASGCVVRLGIYSDSNGTPGSLLIDAGTVVGDAATGYKKIGISQALAPGTYWLCAVVQTAISGFIARAINTPSQPISYTNFATTAAASATHNGVQRTATATAGLPGTFGACTSIGGVLRVMIEV